MNKRIRRNKFRQQITKDEFERVFLNVLNRILKEDIIPKIVDKAHKETMEKWTK